MKFDIAVQYDEKTRELKITLVSIVPKSTDVPEGFKQNRSLTFEGKAKKILLNSVSEMLSRSAEED